MNYLCVMFFPARYVDNWDEIMLVLKYWWTNINDMSNDDETPQWNVCIKRKGT